MVNHPIWIHMPVPLVIRHVISDRTTGRRNRPECDQWHQNRCFSTPEPGPARTPRLQREAGERLAPWPTGCSSTWLQPPWPGSPEERGVDLVWVLGHLMTSCHPGLGRNKTCLWFDGLQDE